MTREQLYNHFELRQELKQAVEVLTALRAAASPGAQALTGMPHVPVMTDKTGDLAAEIVDIEQEISRIQETIGQEEPEILSFISAIRSSRTRTIFRLRILRGFSWKEISIIFGKWTTAKSCKSTFWNYVDTHCKGRNETP